MRLPAVTKKQRETEDSRTFHEALWSAYCASAPLTVATGPVTNSARNFAAQLSMAKQSFWTARGYRVRVRTRGKQTVVWLEPKARVAQVA